MASGRQRNTKKSSGRSGNQKKTTTRSTRSGKNTSGTRKRTKQAAKANQLKDEIMVLIALACAIILILSNFNLAGVVGVQIKRFLFGMIGITAYIFPFILAGTLIFLISNRDLIGVARVKTVAVYILTIFLSGICQRLSSLPVIDTSQLGTFYSYSAQSKTGGGLLGGILCKMLAPVGEAGSLVIMIILSVVCIIVITEKSFIRGMQSVGQHGARMMHAAKQDYDIYKEHSTDRMQADLVDDDDRESEEEYLRRRRQQKETSRQERLAKKEEQMAAKRSRQQEKQEVRMQRKALGVTADTTLQPDVPGEDGSQLRDIREITIDTNRIDQFSSDIYDPHEITTVGNMANEQETVNFVQEPEQIEDSFIPEEQIKPDFLRDLEFEKEEDANQLIQIDRQGTVKESVKEVIKEEAIPLATMNSMRSETPVNAGVVEKQSDSDNDSKSSDKKEYQFPPISLLKKSTNRATTGLDKEHKETAIRLQQTLQNFGVKVTITDISCGPSVTRYELQPEQGVKVSKIVSLSDDIKLNLAAADIRIEAPIPGKAAIGIEVPNKEAGSVMLRELLETDSFMKHPSPISFAAGKDIAGKTIVADIAKMPHLLIAGATGSGKSVCINTIIMSILYKAHPDDVKLIMIDPKVVELSVYNGIPHLMIPVVTDPKKASGALNWAVAEMTDRYKRFADMHVRDLKGYNEKIAKLDNAQEEGAPQKMPQLVIIIDELADLMMVAPGEVEDAICRLAQLARAAGIHLVIATQRPSVNVITGLIKANVPSRIAFSVSSGVDSRTIIDMNGAEKLLGKGDMLFFPSGYPKPVRVQGAFVSDEEVGQVVDFLKNQMGEEVTYNEQIAESITSAQSLSERAVEEERDSYFADAGRFVIEKEKGSIGMLQRYYKIGFNRAGRIMDQLADAGVVGPEVGTKPRKIEMTMEEFEEYLKKIS